MAFIIREVCQINMPPKKVTDCKYNIKMAAPGFYIVMIRPFFTLLGYSNFNYEL